MRSVTKAMTQQFDHPWKEAPDALPPLWRNAWVLLGISSLVVMALALISNFLIATLVSAAEPAALPAAVLPPEVVSNAWESPSWHRS